MFDTIIEALGPSETGKIQNLDHIYIYVYIYIYIYIYIHTYVFAR